MTIFLQFAVLGIGTAAVYSLLAQGLVAIQLGSGVLNLAQGAIAMLAAYLYWQFHMEWGWSTVVAFVGSVATVALLSPVVYIVALRGLRHSSSLARVVATLGLLLLITGFVAVVWGTNGKTVDPIFPTNTFTIGDVFVPVDRLWMLGIAAAVTVVLWAAYRLTPIGLAIRASADHARSASALGWSPDLLATISWCIGGALAGLTGVMLAPLIGVDAVTIPFFVIPVVAAALLGSFSSFPLTFVGAVGIGVASSLITYYEAKLNEALDTEITGLVWSLPFLVIVLVIAVRGKGLPVRGSFVERLPAVGSGRIRLRIVGPAVAVTIALMYVFFPNSLLDALVVSLAWATIMLSVVVLLGYTSQLSFEQMAMAGLAALIAARLVDLWSVPFEVAFVAAVLAAVPIGVLFALPALRTRGINLAVVTLGLGAAIYYMIFNSRTFTGGNDGTPVGRQTLFGIPIDFDRYPERYAIFALVAFSVCAVAVANVRRGRAGSALMAVRTNERAAAALGISVFQTKLFAFILGASVAAIGGLVLAFRNTTVPFFEYEPFQSILVVGFTIFGGVGFVMGPLLGSQFASGGIGTWMSDEILNSPPGYWLTLLGGFAVLFFVNVHPDGLVELQVRRFKRQSEKRRIKRGLPLAAAEPMPVVPRVRARPVTLVVENVTVRFGGVTAVDQASLEVRPGEVVGLIGPNGAGKSTLIDAITGFVRPSEGMVYLDGEQIDGLPVHQRVGLGVSRSFQSLELFEQNTVRENLQVASDRCNALDYARDIVAPTHQPLSAAAAAAVREFELEGELEETVQELSYGHRRLVAIARAMAVDPSLLLLDEPAAGLSRGESVELGEVVKRLASEWGIGILLVEHDMAFVMETCDRVVVLDFGRKIADATPEVIRRDPAVIAAYLGTVDDEMQAAAPSPAAT